MSAEVTSVDLDRRLSGIERDLAYVVERHRMVEDLIAEGTLIGREVIRSTAEPLAEAERKGWFAVGRELAALADRVVEAYGPGEVAALAENAVAVLDTLRNLTQPDVLAFANDATDVLHHADDVKPVGMFGAAKASSDPEVQRGLGVALEILRHLGRAHGSAPTHAPPTPAPPTHAPPTQGPPARRFPRAAPATPAACAAPEEPASPEVVVWEGRRFDSRGFLVDPADWDEDLAAKLAQGLGLALTDDHWTAIRWARQQWAATGQSPNVRRVATGSGLGTQRIYELFPNTPGKTTAMLAGIPKPVGCI